MVDYHVVLDSWVEEKITELTSKVENYFNQEEVKNSRFPKIGNTNTLRWEAQLEILNQYWEWRNLLEALHRPEEQE